MLNVPSPFPQVGSEALHEFEGRTYLVRIIGRDPGGNATIAIPARFGASGNRTVPLAELADCTPLIDDELAEFARLERTVAAKPSRSRRIRALQLRYAALRDRFVNSETMRQLRRELPRMAA